MPKEVDYSDLKYIMGVILDATVSRHKAPRIELSVVPDRKLTPSPDNIHNAEQAMVVLINEFINSVVDIIAHYGQGDECDVDNLLCHAPDNIDLTQVKEVEEFTMLISSLIDDTVPGQRQFFPSKADLDIVINKDIDLNDNVTTDKIGDALYFIINERYTEMISIIDHYTCDGLIQQSVRLPFKITIKK